MVPPPENYQFTVLESLPTRSVVATIRAADADVGANAEMDYRIMDSDGPGVFNVSTDEDTQDGIITLLKVTPGWMGLDGAEVNHQRTGMSRYKQDTAQIGINVPAFLIQQPSAPIN